MLYTNLNIYSELANREYIYLNVPQNFRSKISIGARNGCPKTIRENVIRRMQFPEVLKIQITHSK